MQRPELEPKPRIANRLPLSHIFQTLAVGASGIVVAAAIVALLIHGEQQHQRAL